jgi:hypothetical protein
VWTHGTADVVVADGAAWEVGTLGFPAIDAQERWSATFFGFLDSVR